MTDQMAEKLTPELHALAARQWHDYQRRTPGTYFGEDHSALSIDDAYTVQRELARLRCQTGDTVAGYKVGCIGPAVVEQFGMSGPIYARLFSGELQASGVVLNADDYVNLAIEGEMAVEIGADGAISAAFPVIELHQFLFRGARKTLVELVANNGINAGVVLPPVGLRQPLERWAAAHAMTVAIDGEALDTGNLWGMGDAAQAVDWLRENLAQHGGALAPGDLVLAGTPLGLYPVEAGQTVTVTVDDRDPVSCRIL